MSAKFKFKFKFKPKGILKKEALKVKLWLYLKRLVITFHSIKLPKFQFNVTILLTILLLL